MWEFGIEIGRVRILSSFFELNTPDEGVCRSMRPYLPPAPQFYGNAFVIDPLVANNISSCLEYGSVEIRASTSIVITSEINWTNATRLSLISQKNVVFKPSAFIGYDHGSLILKSGIENDAGEGTVIFESEKPQISCTLEDGASTKIYYNPIAQDSRHKYYSPYGYFQHATGTTDVEEYMLINTVEDLQNMRILPSGNYALSKSINATVTTEWNDGKGFEPIYVSTKEMSFCGAFDGNNYSISGLYIKRTTEDNVGLFANILGTETAHVQISNLKMENAYIEGDHRVGALAGNAVYVDISNVILENVAIVGRAVAGGLVGTLCYSTLNALQNPHRNISVTATEKSSTLVGALVDSSLHFDTDACSVDLVGYTESHD